MALACYACGDSFSGILQSRPPRAVCARCTRAGARATAGLCLLCDHGPAHPRVEFCARCWVQIPVYARTLYHAVGRGACLAFLAGHAAALVRLSKYHR